MTDINITFENAMDQAVGTAEHYFVKAWRMLEECSPDKNWETRDVIELAKIMSDDFSNTVMCMKIQEIRKALEKISEHDIGEAIRDGLDGIGCELNKQLHK